MNDYLYRAVLTKVFLTTDDLKKDPELKSFSDEEIIRKTKSWAAIQLRTPQYEHIVEKSFVVIVREETVDNVIEMLSKYRVYAGEVEGTIVKKNYLKGYKLEDLAKELGVEKGKRPSYLTALINWATRFQTYYAGSISKIIKHLLLGTPMMLTGKMGYGTDKNKLLGSLRFERSTVRIIDEEKVK